VKIVAPRYSEHWQQKASESTLLRNR